MAVKNEVFYCRHCQDYTTGVLIFSTNGIPEVLEYKGDRDAVLTYLFLIKCNICSEPSLLSDWEASDNPGKLSEAQILFPGERGDSQWLPKSLRDTLKEAKRIKKNAPIAFVILIRKSLEIICDDKGAIGKNLKEKITNLALQGTIPETLAQLAGAIRFFGNIGAHEAETEITFEQKDILEDFILAIIEYAYIAPEKLEKLRSDLLKKG